MVKQFSALALAAAVTVAASPSFGGAQYNEAVVVSLACQSSTSPCVAYGAMGSVYHSADSQQYIGCEIIYTRGGNNEAECFASDNGSPANQGVCTTNDPGILAALGAMTEDAFVGFEWNNMGVCTLVEIEPNSYWIAK